MKVSKFQILSLYRKILKDSKIKLKYTDKEYFRKRMRLEFTVKPKNFDETMKHTMYMVNLFSKLKN
jgi:hypothetical protein